MKKIISLGLFLLITLMLFNTINEIDNKKFKNVDNQVKFKNYLHVDFDHLSQKNSDIEGWIIVKNTDINYPILKTDNNDFYQNHNFDKEEDKKGSIFQDATDASLDSKVVTLYGNNLNKKMFADLRKIHNKELGSDVFIKIITKKYINTYKVYENERNKVVNSDYEIDVTNNDNILVLKSLGGTYEYVVRALQIGSVEC